MPRVLAVGSWNLNRGAGCGDAESSSNRTESDLVPESDSGSMNRDRGTAYRSLFPATMITPPPCRDVGPRLCRFRPIRDLMQIRGTSLFDCYRQAIS